MQVQKRQLAPGVALRIVHTDKFKSAVLGVHFLLPLDRAAAAECALIPSVLRRGCARYPDMESLSAALDELYGGGIEATVRRKGETQCVGFTAGFLDDAYSLDGEPLLERAVALLGDVTLRPAQEDGCFRADYVAGERANLIDRIRARKNEKTTYAIQRLAELMCADEAFGVDKLGEEDAAAAITPQSLWARYQTLLRECPVSLYYCGSADPDRVAAAFAAAFPLPARACADLPGCEVRETAAEVREFTERMEVAQGKLTLGFRTGGVTLYDERFPALLVFNAAFGGSTNSKLFLNVRERLSLCYYASSILERRKGVMFVASGVDIAKFGTARDEILAQLAALVRGELSDEELSAARQSVLTDWKGILDAQSQLEDHWLGCAAAGMEQPPESLIERVAAVTRDEIAALARAMSLDGIYYLTGQEG